MTKYLHPYPLHTHTHTNKLVAAQQRGCNQVSSRRPHTIFTSLSTSTPLSIQCFILQIKSFTALDTGTHKSELVTVAVKLIYVNEHFKTSTNLHLQAA